MCDIVCLAGVRGEDTGILACQRLGNDDIIAYTDVTVYGKALSHLSVFVCPLLITAVRSVAIIL